MKVPFYGHVRQYHNLQAEIDAAIRAVLESGEYVMGPTLARFEKKLAAYAGMKHAIGVNSGTDAIWLSLMALGIGPGDEVITTANTFFATAEAIWIAGAKVVFVEIEPDTCLIDATRIEAAITPRTRAIVPVHLYGQMADMRAIHAIAQKHNLVVIEDNAQAIDARGPDFALGELSDALATSFIIQKNLGTSDRRREIARMYNEGLRETGLQLPTEKPGYRHVYHLYVIEVGNRDAMLKYLNDNGVDAKLHYPIAIHQQEGYPWGKDADPHPSLPLTERHASRVISLPMFPELTQDEIDYTIEVCRKWAKANL